MGITDLIIVACHAPFKNDVTIPLDDPSNDSNWILFPFQKGEPGFYVEHIKTGVNLLKADKNSILIFSGGYSRKDSENWSEADSYLQTAKHYNFWTNILTTIEFSKLNCYALAQIFEVVLPNINTPGYNNTSLEKRIFLEEYARDSFENLLFSICRFNEITARYPEKINLISWKFKKERFLLHCNVIGYPLNRFKFTGVNNPENLTEALTGEAKAIDLFKSDFYGNTGLLLKKRNSRNPFNKNIPYHQEDDLKEFFAFINNPINSRRLYPQKLPWDIHNDRFPKI